MIKLNWKLNWVKSVYRLWTVVVTKNMQNFETAEKSSMKKDSKNDLDISLLFLLSIIIFRCYIRKTEWWPLHSCTPVSLNTSANPMVRPEFPLSVKKIAGNTWTKQLIFKFWFNCFLATPWLISVKSQPLPATPSPLLPCLTPYVLFLCYFA